MFTPRTQGVYTIRVVAQIVLAQLLYWWLFILLGLFYKEDIFQRWREYITLAEILFISMIIQAAFFDKNKFDLLATSWKQNNRIALSQLGYFMTFLFAYFVLGKETLASRFFIGFYFFAFYALMLVTNRFLPSYFSRRLFKPEHQHRLILVGSLSKAIQVQKWIENKTPLGFQVVGLITEDKGKAFARGVKILGQLKDLERIIQEEQVTQVFILELPLLLELGLSLVTLCNRYGLRMIIRNDLDEMVGHSLVMDYCDGLKLISLRTEPLENPYNRFIKRIMDVAISLPVVVLILPLLCPVVWLFQVFQSPGRLFYWQTRAGLGNRKFQILKFRTMPLNHGSEAKQAHKGDTRVYPAGRWLRKFSIDEVPQFVNVLLGDMSVVGPRPHLIQHNKKFEKELSHYNIRSFVKPGITGLAQVRGFRGEILTPSDLKNRIESDLYYIENWTFTLDLVIVGRTFWHMIRPPEKSV